MSDELDRLRSYIDAVPPATSEQLAASRAKLEAGLRSEVGPIGQAHIVGGRRRWLTRHGNIRPRALVIPVTLVIIVTLALVGALLANQSPAKQHAADHGETGHQVVVTLVSDDVDASIASGSYDMTFTDTATPPTNCSTQVTGGGPGLVGGSAQQCSVPFFADTSGHGTVDTNPYAMVAVAKYGSSTVVTTYDNGTDVWEFGGGGYGVYGSDSAAPPGAPLSGYAGSVEGSVGQQAGALDMQALASTTGYLDLEATEIEGAQPAGMGTVDGVPVTVYRLFMTGLQDPTLAGLSAEQVQTIQAADAILRSTGFKGKTVLVSVDAKGYVREVKTTYTLSNGSAVTQDTELSNFGCAGTVLMPGQSGSSTPPAGCVSPDTISPAEGSTTTTTTEPLTTSSLPPTTFEIPTPPSNPLAPTTTVPASGTSPKAGLTIAVTPGGPYRTGEVVTIKGTDFPASVSVNVGECPPDIDCIDWLHQATTDANGSFSAQLVLQSTFTLSQPVNGQSSWTCATASDGCELFAAPMRGPEASTIPVVVGP